jgi:hypothetical protein
LEFLQAAEAPVVETVRGTPITFPLLDIDDYTPWCAELHNVRKVKSKSLIPKNAEPVDAFRMARMAEFDEPSLDAVAALVWTPMGAKRVLGMSLAKADVPEADRTQIIRAVPPRRIISLAVEVSGLFERKVPDLQQAKGQPDPNAGAAADEGGAAEGTGS